MGKYVFVAIAALSLAGCYTTAPNDSAAAGGSAATASNTHNVGVRFDTGVEKTVPTDYNLRQGDRVIMLSNGKVGPL